MQTILGANGIIGREISLALKAHTPHIRQVSRDPKKINAGDTTCVADLLDARATATAVAGSEVVYLVAGLTYNAAIWQAQWPVVMRNTIDACKLHGARLVFFDNVYAYGRVDGVMTEATPFNPVSKKGEVRAQVASMLLEEIRRSNLQAMIVRAADFYGPDAPNSFLHSVVFERLKAGKSPQWLGNPKAHHTFSFTQDAGRAIAALGQLKTAFGQTWHLPASKEVMTGEGFVRLACDLSGQPFRLQVAPLWMAKLMGVFIPMMRENQEMMYQLLHDYQFDSSKIAAAFGLQATPYREGIRRTLAQAAQDRP